MSQQLYNPKTDKFSEGAAAAFLAMGTTPTDASVDAVKNFLQRHVKEVTASQLRNVFARIRPKGNFQTTKDNLPMVRVKLAYMKGKSNFQNKGFHSLIDILDAMLREISATEDEKECKDKLKGLGAFFEAVLAYHKYFENFKNERS